MPRASVETKSIDAASDWADLYRAANNTTTVASGKLQQINASRENGLCTSSKRSRMNSIAACTETRPREPGRISAESRTGGAASTNPTLQTAPPEVAEPISSKLLVTTDETRIFATTTAIPKTGPQSRGDLSPA